MVEATARCFFCVYKGNIHTTNHWTIIMFDDLSNFRCENLKSKTCD